MIKKNTFFVIIVLIPLIMLTCFAEDKKTVKNLTVVDVREDENILLVQGAVPGAKNGLVSIYTKA